MGDADFHKLIALFYVAQFFVKPDCRLAGMQEEMKASPLRKMLLKRMHHLSTVTFALVLTVNCHLANFYIRS